MIRISKKTRAEEDIDALLNEAAMELRAWIQALQERIDSLTAENEVLRIRNKDLINELDAANGCVSELESIMDKDRGLTK